MLKSSMSLLALIRRLNSGKMSLSALLIFSGVLCSHSGSRAARPPKGCAEETAAHDTPGPFTVADSIQMTHFVDPPEHAIHAYPQFSPDGKRFFILTEKGDLGANLREYSLLVLNANKLNEKPTVVTSFHTSSNSDGMKAPHWVDDENIAFIGENRDEVPQIFIVDCRTRKTTKLTSAPTGVVAYDITHDGREIVYYANWLGDKTDNKYKEEHGFSVTDEQLSTLASGTWNRLETYYQMYSMDRASGRVREIQSGPFSFPDSRLQIWLSPDGKYAVTEQPAVSVPSAWQSYEEGVLSRLAKDHPGVQPRLRQLGISQAFLVNMATGKVTPLLDSPTSYTLDVLWAADSQSVLVANTFLPLNTSDRAELLRRRSLPVLAQVDIPTLSFRRLAEIPVDIEWRLRPGGSADTFLVNAYEMELQDNEELFPTFPTVRFKKQKAEWTHETIGAEAANGSNKNIRIRETLDQWPRLVKVDPATHNESVVLDPNPQFKNFHFGHVEVIHWTGKRGEALAGGLVYPTDYRPGIRYPLVIQTHGFNPDEFLLDGPFTTAFAAQELANKGVAVLQLGDSPLFDRSELTPEFGPANLSQFESAIDHLDQKGIIDRDRVGLVGFSINCYLVRYALMRSRYHFAVATAAEGNDWGYWSYLVGANSPLWQTQSEAPYGGPPWDGNWKPWLQESITFNYDKIHTPMRLEDDSGPAAVLTDWENFVALKRLRKPVDLILVPNGAHPVVKPWHRLTSQEGNVDWLIFWLKGEEDPNPAKAEQYRRWHELRILQEADSEGTASGH